MTTAAEIICYIQPAKAISKDAGVAWVDTSKTATIRRAITSKAEALQVIAEAKEIARAMGDDMVVKTMARSICGARRPVGVKALQGASLV